MKKIFLAIVLASLVATSSFAAEFVYANWVDGKIAHINTDSSGNFVIYMTPTDGSVEKLGVLNLTGDARKEFIAMVLTAKASDSTIKLYSEQGVWKYFSY